MDGLRREIYALVRCRRVPLPLCAATAADLRRAIVGLRFIGLSIDLCRPLFFTSARNRYTYFRKLGIEDLLLIAYRETVAASGIPAGSEKSPAELDLKSWHNFVVRAFKTELTRVH